MPAADGQAVALAAHTHAPKILMVVHAWCCMPFQNERLKPDQYIILRRLV